MTDEEETDLHKLANALRRHLGETILPQMSLRDFLTNKKKKSIPIKSIHFPVHEHDEKWFYPLKLSSIEAIPSENRIVVHCVSVRAIEFISTTIILKKVDDAK